MTAKEIYDVADAIKFLKTPKTKVAMQFGYDGPYVFVEKGDFIQTLKSGPRTTNCSQFVNYDGESDSVFIENDVLHVPVGVTF